jgi:hypothetical protein
VESPSLQPSGSQGAAPATGQQTMPEDQFNVMHEQELRRCKRLRAD